MITSLLFPNNSMHLQKILSCTNSIFKNDLAVVPKINQRHFRSVEKKPDAVVFMLGWTGCSERNLKKYIEIYEEKGFHVIKYCPSLRITYGVNPKKHLLSQSQVLLDELTKKGLRNAPIYFHNFSSGGVYMYYTLLRQIKEKGFVNINVAGTVFDSSPAPSSISMAYNAAYAVVPGNKVSKTAIASLAGLWALIIPRVNAMRAYVNGLSSDIENFRSFVAEHLARFPKSEPQHFMYSEADKVVPARGVEWFIEERRKMGVRVSLTKWQDSNHVEHMLKYPNEYRSSLENFLDSCKELNEKDTKCVLS